MQYLKDPYFSAKRIEKELGVGNEKPQAARDHSDYDSMLVRGFRVAQRIQQKNNEQFKDLGEQYITTESLKRVAECILAKAVKAEAAGKQFTVITYLSALSDFPDGSFDWDKQEQQINKMIRESFKSMSVRLAFGSFIQTIGDERAQNSRKLSQKLMREFS